LENEWELLTLLFLASLEKDHIFVSETFPRMRQEKKAKKIREPVFELT
jgi:hypothetical protein